MRSRVLTRSWMAFRLPGGQSNDSSVSIIQTFEAQLLAQYGDQLLSGQFQALNAMKHCRTAASPRMQTQCEDCTTQCYVPHSCGHRLGPHCQHHESEQWLQRQLKRQVPGDYFLLTFTLPAEFQSAAWQLGPGLSNSRFRSRLASSRDLTLFVILCRHATVASFAGQ